MKPWDWKAHVAIALAVGACVVTFLLTTEGCSTPVKVDCPNGLSVETKTFAESADDNLSPEDVRELCGAPPYDHIDKGAP